MSTSTVSSDEGWIVPPLTRIVGFAPATVFATACVTEEHLLVHVDRRAVGVVIMERTLN
jgi:hypothetical protein